MSSSESSRTSIELTIFGKVARTLSCWLVASWHPRTWHDRSVALGPGGEVDGSPVVCFERNHHPAILDHPRRCPSGRSKMQLVDLNADVLSHITDFLERDDISRLFRTCRLLRDKLVPAILKEHIILDKIAIVSFGKFMHLDSQDDQTRRDRFYFLRHLRYNPLVGFATSISFPNPATVHTLTEILRHARSLVSLSLISVTIVFTPKELRAALSAPLPMLQEITLDGVTPEYNNSLANVASRIRTLKLNLKLKRRPADSDPLPFLQFHRSTITTLSLFNVALTDLGVPLPSVRVLEVLSYLIVDDETGWVGPLVHLFPNVEHVQFSSLYARDGSSPMRGLDPRDASALLEADRWRGRAKAWQTQRGSWANGLRSLCVRSVMALYCLGISCRIDRVDVLNPTPSRSVTAAALADAQPQCMAIRISTASDLESVVSALLPAVALTPSVTHLLIELRDYLLWDLDLQNLCVSTIWEGGVGICDVRHPNLAVCCRCNCGTTSGILPSRISISTYGTAIFPGAISCLESRLGMALRILLPPTWTARWATPPRWCKCWCATTQRCSGFLLLSQIAEV